MIDPLGNPCPQCGAIVGESCREGTGPWVSVDYTHPLRLPTMNGDMPSVQEFDDAVERSGLV